MISRETDTVQLYNETYQIMEFKILFEIKWFNIENQSIKDFKKEHSDVYFGFLQFALNLWKQLQNLVVLHRGMHKLK